MNIALLCVLIIVTGETYSFHVINARTPHMEELGQRTLSSRLHTFQRDDSKEMKTATWNQILAEALLNRIKIVSSNKETERKMNDAEIKSNFLTNCVSQMMHLHKVLIYDKIIRCIDNTNVKVDPHLKIGEENNKKRFDNAHKVVVTVNEKDYKDPKDEVEIFDPSYHGKLCDDCEENSEKDSKSEMTETVGITDTVGKSVAGYPDGLVPSVGNSLGSAPKSKYISKIPNHCPIGHKFDSSGVCRPEKQGL